MSPSEMTMAETPAPPGGQSAGQPEPSVAELLSAACVQATGLAMARMEQNMKAAGHAPPGVPPSAENNA
jgi:hypothetical protein